MGAGNDLRSQALRGDLPGDLLGYTEATRDMGREISFEIVIVV